MAAANYLSSSSSDFSSGDENDDSTKFEGVDKLDLSHQELDSEMLRFHLQELSEVPERFKNYFLSSLVQCESFNVITNNVIIQLM